MRASELPPRISQRDGERHRSPHPVHALDQPFEAAAIDLRTVKLRHPWSGNPEVRRDDVLAAGANGPHDLARHLAAEHEDLGAFGHAATLFHVRPATAIANQRVRANPRMMAMTSLDSRRVRHVIAIGLDVVLLVALLLLLSPRLTGLPIYEWLGIALGVPLLVHLLLS